MRLMPYPFAEQSYFCPGKRNQNCLKQIKFWTYIQIVCSAICVKLSRCLRSNTSNTKMYNLFHKKSVLFISFGNINRKFPTFIKHNCLLDLQHLKLSFIERGNTWLQKTAVMLQLYQCYKEKKKKCLFYNIIWLLTANIYSHIIM